MKLENIEDNQIILKSRAIELEAIIQTMDDLQDKLEIHREKNFTKEKETYDLRE